MSDLSDIKKVVESKSLDPETSIITTQCMVELCLQSVGEKKLENLGSLLEGVDNAVIAFDNNLFLFDANSLGKEIIENHLNFNFNNTNYSINNLPIFEEVKIASEGSKEPVEISSLDRQNKRHYFNAAASPIFNEKNEFIGYCLILDDITKSKIEQSKAEDMLSALTHDLKTPLVATDTSLKHILEGYYGEINNNVEEVLIAIKSSNFDALCLVRNLLSTLKYETKDYKLYFDETEVSKIISDIKLQIDPLLLEKDLNLKEIYSNFKFSCDVFEIKRVLINLLTNAIKYSPKNSTIEIKAAKDEEGNVIFKVKDYGKGIEAKHIENLFDRFWKASSSGYSSVGSTGLGLYLSKQIIEAHKGTIWATSEIGKGTEVTFKLPYINNQEEK